MGLRGTVGDQLQLSKETCTKSCSLEKLEVPTRTTKRGRRSNLLRVKFGFRIVIDIDSCNVQESENQVFHVLTDGENYFSMKLWFFSNTYKQATVQVLNIEGLNLNDHDKATLSRLSLSEEFRISFHGVDEPSRTRTRTQYMSVFSHSHYLLPEIFHTLKKVVVLDDDIVVQQDLSALWSLDLEGKVNGAVQFCAVRLAQLKNYLGENISDGNSCAWMSGLNIVDLARWRELDLTGTFQRLLQEVSGCSS